MRNVLSLDSFIDSEACGPFTLYLNRGILPSNTASLAVSYWIWGRDSTILLASSRNHACQSWHHHHFAVQAQLLDSLYGLDRGLNAGGEIKGEISELILKLEAVNPTPEPNKVRAQRPET